MKSFLFAFPVFSPEQTLLPKKRPAIIQIISCIEKKILRCANLILTFKIENIWSNVYLMLKNIRPV